MAVTSVAPLINPQYITTSSAAVTFAPTSVTAVPANTVYQLQTVRVVNNSAAPVTLEVWRVPSGSTADNQHEVVPIITIPTASLTLPWIDIGALWGANLKAGDAIWVQAGTATSLLIWADGLIVVGQ